MAFAVHLQRNGEPFSFLLDVVEVAESHTGKALAAAFFDMLEAFGILDKVSGMSTPRKGNAHPMHTTIFGLRYSFRML